MKVFSEFPESEDLQSLEDFLVIEELTRLVDNLEHEVSESSYEIVKLKSENKNLKLKNGILAAINDEDQKEIERLRWVLFRTDLTRGIELWTTVWSARGRTSNEFKLISENFWLRFYLSRFTLWSWSSILEANAIDYEQ